MKLLASATFISLLLAAQNLLAQINPGDGSKDLPEPGVWALMGIGLVAAAVHHFKKR